MAEKLENRILLMYAAVLLLVIGAGAYLLKYNLDFTKLRRQSEESRSRLETLQDAFSALVDAETGARGYVITGSREYLDPYLAAFKDLVAIQQRAESLFAPQTPEGRQWEDIKGSMRLRVDQLALDIRMRELGGFEAAQREILSGMGKLSMDKVHELMGAMVSAEKENQLGLTRESTVHAGRLLWLWMGYAVVVVGLLALAYGSLVREHAKLRALRERLQHAATHDVLTGIPNRALFESVMEQELALARRDGQQRAVLYIDLDGFKAVNDAHGHKAGDAVLIAVSERLRAAVRESDLVARIGGDEFAVFCSVGDPRKDCTRIARKILSSLQPRLLPVLQDCSVSASIGIASFPADGQDMESLVAAGDRAMYSVKTGKKNGYAFA